MNRIYVLLAVLFLGGVACTPTKVVEEVVTEIAQDDVTVVSDASYETVILKGDIPSPQKQMIWKLGAETIRVTYGSPSVKGRQVWGGLVPYDKVWRTGANEATTFESSTTLKIQGKELAAGKYGLFTIPKKGGEWVVIFNKKADQWGAYDYSESEDVIRVTAEADTRGNASETLEFMVEDDNLVLKWEKLALPIKIAQ